VSETVDPDPPPEPASPRQEPRPPTAGPQDTTQIDVLIVGGGPAGLSAATELRRLGVRKVLVADREAELGGIPRHSCHTGYGIRDLRRFMTGPTYARQLIESAREAHAELRAATTVTSLEPVPSGGHVAELTSARGRERVLARAVLIATGCRERPRSARLIPGDRPAGIMTTGELQQRVYLNGERLSGRAVVVGAEHVGFSAALTLAHAGAEVVALVTEQPRHQSYAAFRLGAALRWRLPVWTSAAVSRITGRGKLTGVEITDTHTGARRFVECGTLVFTADWIPDHELARATGLDIDPGTRGPAVDTTLRSSAPGIFAAGNVIHAAETADIAALSGRHAATHIAAYLADATRPGTTRPAPTSAALAIHVESPLSWISPNVIRFPLPGTAPLASTDSPPDTPSPSTSDTALPDMPSSTQQDTAPPDTTPHSARNMPPPLGRFTLRSGEFRGPARLEVRQGGRRLAISRPMRLIPGRPVHLHARWLADVDPAGGSIRVGVATSRP
jgi:thioredoxin reductase